MAACTMASPPPGFSGFITPGTAGSPTTVTCNSSSVQTTRVGQGGTVSPAPPAADYVNVTVNNGASVNVLNQNAISLGSNATITLGTGSGAAVIVQTTTNGSATNGQYGDGDNTIDVNNNSLIIINKNASVIAAGTQGSSEAINPYGSGNTIINYGVIQGGPSNALYFENANTNGSSPRNVVDNFGQIISPNHNALGSNGAVGIDFLNETGASVIGNLIFGGGNDRVTINPNSTITGTLDGGGGTNLLTLNASGTSSDVFAGSINNFQTLNKTGSGIWTLTGAIGANGGAVPLIVNVVGGTLQLTGNNVNFNGSIVINPGVNLATPGADPTATLEAPAESLPPLITDHGILLVNQPNAGTYAGLVQGTGVLTKIGAGTLTLTGANTYSGGTNLNVGTIAVAADNALGAPTGPLTFNGGALQFLSSFNLSTGRAIVLNAANGGYAGGGTIDSNGFQTTIAQAITGAGGLTVTDSTSSTGVVTLTGANTYTGGTTISAGTLQLGNGGASGSILGDVTDNGKLAFNRSDISSFAGVVSGSGSVTQIGTGTTVLTANNTYTGGTTISAGTLQLGNGGASGSILGDVTDNGKLAFNRSDVTSFAGVISGSGAVSQIGTGTTILNADNSFTGPTSITAGALAVGDSAHLSAALSGGGPISVGASGALGGYGGVAGNVTSLGVVAVADALPVFSGGPTGAFTIGGDFQNQGTAQIAGSSIGNVLLVKGDYGTGAGSGSVNIKTFLNEGGPLSNQSTDRMLVLGNAAGNTLVHVNAIGAGAFTSAETPSADHGISLVQVAGASSVSAFTLSGGYVSGGTPYQYHLYAYGPGSPYGSAAANQNLVGNAGANWDYRLENVYVSPGQPNPPPGPPAPDSRPEVTPEVPAYLSLPTALFNAGFQDLDSLHRRLGEIRDTKNPTDGEVFARAYGAGFNYVSNRSFANYGYNSEQDYAAAQFGANWIAHNSAEGVLRLGLAVSFGQLWLQPHAVDGASNARYSNDTLLGALTWQSRSGWYVDAILAGGRYFGSISTDMRGRALSMGGNSFSASLETGYPMPLGWEGLTLEPQVQFVYQRLMFEQRTDIDGTNVNLGNPNEGVFRGGVRLIRQYTASDGTPFTPYLKANILQGIGGGQTVSLGNVPFLTGGFGTSLQVGGGWTGTVAHNVSLYGDLAWQDAIGSGGTRGWTGNIGLRYAF